MKPVILIARPRSGTTALRGMVARHPKIMTLGEIFHENSIDHPHYFFSYYLGQIRKAPELALPSSKNRIALFSGYIEYLESQLHEAFPTKDWFFAGVNYNSLHIVNSYWQNFFEEPFFLKIIKWKKYSIVHLVRENLLEAAVSEMRAKLSGVWHIRAGEERPANANLKVRLDADNLLRELRARELEVALIEKSMSGYAKCLTLKYEQFFDAFGKPRPEEITKLEKFLALDSRIEPVAVYSKTRTEHLRDAIENYDEIAASLKLTEFARMLDPA